MIVTTDGVDSQLVGCSVQSDTQATCALPPLPGLLSLSFVASPNGDGDWVTLYLSSTLTYTVLYVAYEPYALQLVAFPVAAVAGPPLSPLVVNILDGSGSLATGNSYSWVTVSLSSPSSSSALVLSPSGMAANATVCPIANIMVRAAVRMSVPTVCLELSFLFALLRFLGPFCCSLVPF